MIGIKTEENRNTCLVKLVSGEEIIGDVLHVDCEVMILKNPLSVGEMESEGESAIVLQPFITFDTSSQVTLNNKHVIAYSKAYPEMQQYYDLSLEVSIRYETRRLENLRVTNELMIERLTDSIEELSYEESIGKILHKGTNTIN